MINEYNQHWKLIDERHHVAENPYMDLIRLDVFAELHQEMHKEVDKTMRVEYEQLRKARCTDLKQKYKAPKIKKDKKKRAKGKKKKLTDFTEDRSIQSLFDELVEKDIIFDYPRCDLDDYICDSNYVAYELRNYSYE